MKAPRPFSVLIPLAALVLAPSCRGKHVLEQRCLAGEDAACEAACDKGVVGEGGCFQAGTLHFRRGALDFTSADFKRARTYFEKACSGGYGDGCLFAAETIDAPYGPLDTSALAKAPPTISDAELAEREGLLSRACTLAGGASCKRLGDVLIGKVSGRAGDAYRRACEASRAPEACKAERTKEVATLEGWRTACTRGVADDCTKLGDALYAIDAPRAVRLFASECALRGVESFSDGVDGFVLDRARSAGGGAAFAASRVPAAPSAGGPRVVAGVPVVRGSVALVALDRAIRMRADDLAGCVSTLPKTARGTLRAELVVDLTGDVWRATASETSLDARQTACVLRTLEEIGFGSPLPSPATATVPFSIGEEGAEHRPETQARPGSPFQGPEHPVPR